MELKKSSIHLQKVIQTRCRLGFPLGFLSLFFFISCAGNQPRISDIHQDFTNVSSRFETYQQSQEEARRRQQKALSEIRTTIERESADIQSRPNEIDEQSGAPVQSTAIQPEREGAAAQDASSPAPEIASPQNSSPSGDSSAAQNPSDVRELFQKAVNKYSKQQYASAAEEFLAAYSFARDDDSKARCLYWAGECYYRCRQWERAVECFVQVETHYPSDPIVPAAVLKKGDSFINNGQIREGKAIFTQLIKAYPNTKEAAQARDRLSALGVLE